MFARLAIAIALTTTVATGSTIPELASSSERLTTLVAAVQAAELGEALSGDGPLTVFAPTNDAFARIDEATLNALLEEPGRETLRRILAHHVVPGRLDVQSLMNRDEIVTLAGTTLSVDTVRDRILIDNAAVESADLVASNGIVHVIDRVLMPPPPESPLRAYLERVIDRGVPLFNNGETAGCAAVYATALDAILNSDGWGLAPGQRAALKSELQDADQMADPRSRAWAYRGIIDDLWDNAMQADNSRQASMNSNDGGVALFDFNDPASLKRWNIVLDGVMGGLSTGRISAGSDTLRFTGETSLRNNGGFSSMRAAIPVGTLAGYDALRLRVKGDGREWIVGTRASSQMGGDSYWTRFKTTRGEWMDVLVPIEQMERHFFGQAMRGTIRPEQVGGIEFYMYDKKAGPFDLEIDRIDAVNTGEI